MSTTITYRLGDVRDMLASMPDDSVDVLVTSPPFLALRSYLPADHPDKHREIGSETTPAAFLDTMLALTADWRRVVTPTGSIAVEIGDTYSGSGGAGGDYGDGGARDGQPKFRQVGSREHRPEREGTTADGGDRAVPVNGGPGWALPKSLCGIPTLYTWSLAYGRNLLTGAESPAGMWRVRNLLTWTRPNPPVGALGDKFRPATSFVTVACVDQKRWFDLDAVRERKERRPSRDGKSAKSGPGELMTGTYDYSTPPNPAGAPPLDWWDVNDVDPDDWQPLHRLSTQPYKGSHYAAFPVALPQRLIEAMCPREVCTVCGEPRRRIATNTRFDTDGNVVTSDFMGGNRDNGMNQKDNDAVIRWGRNERTTIGWTDCRCPCSLHEIKACTICHRYRRGVVLDPFGGSGTTAVAAANVGRDAVLIDLDERNVDLARQRIAASMRIVNEEHDGDTWTWTVEPASREQIEAETNGQLSFFEEAPI